MKNIDWDKTWIGFLLGLIGPSIAFSIYYLINYSYMNLSEFIDYMKLGNTYTPLVSLCVLTNLLPFYLLINKEKYAGTKGVLGATFIWAGLIIFLKFFT
ncbi:MAG: hypothetical protein JWO44_1653 [Bacteroidetes bacterium]|jgi:hypothetical protein|nr:hypothetical protein [Bacteroidota bacterium]